MKKILLSLFLLSAFFTVAQAQSVSVDDSQALPVPEETLSATSDKLNADGLDPDFREEFTLRLKRRYKVMSQKELEKRKKYVEKQISRKAASKNTSLKERLDIELEVINDAIEKAKYPTVQE